MANNVKTTFTADTKPLDRAASKVMADAAKYKAQREKDEAALTQHLAKQTEQRTKLEIKAFQDRLRAAQKYFQQVGQLEQKYAKDNKAALAQFARLPGLSGAAGALGIGLGVGGAAVLTQQAITKAVEQARANRLLASAATEAGVAQSKLAEANKKFAESTGLSNVTAATTTAAVQRLATNAGRPQDLNKLLTSFADLGAARGIGGADLETLIGTILSGQDEGLNRLGIADPGQLQKDYAKTLGKTVEELTQMEKVMAGVNAVVEKSAIFSGAAEARMNSVEGAVAKASAEFDNFTTALASSFAQSYEVNTIISTLTQTLQGMNKEVESLADKAEKGINIDVAIQAAAKDSATVGFFKHLGIGVLTLASQGASVLDFTTVGRAGFAQTSQNLRDQATFLLPDVQQQLQEDAIRQQVNATLLDRANQRRAADAQGGGIAERFLKEFAGIQAKNQLEDAKRLLANPNATIAQLQAASKSGTGGDLDLQQRFALEIFERQKKAADELKKKLEEIKQAKYSLFDSATSGSSNPFINFLGNANREMRSLLDTAKNLSPALRDAFISNAQKGNTEELIGLRLDTRLGGLSLREQAAEFRQGYRNDLSDPKTVQRILDSQLGILGNGPNRYDHVTDSRITSLAQSLDPKLLRLDQREDVANAYEREATRKFESERQALNFYNEMTRLINSEGLKVRIDDGSHLVRVVNEAPDLARVDRRPSRADSATRYGN